MEENKQFRIRFGALVPPIAKQLKEQGFKFDAEEVKHFEKLRESITYLQFADLINDKAREKAVQKLFTKIIQHVMKKNNLKIAPKTERWLIGANGTQVYLVANLNAETFKLVIT